MVGPEIYSIRMPEDFNVCWMQLHQCFLCVEAVQTKGHLHFLVNQYKDFDTLILQKIECKEKVS